MVTNPREHIGIIILEFEVNLPPLGPRIWSGRDVLEIESTRLIGVKVVLNWNNCASIASR